MNFLQLISNIDLLNGALDLSANQIAYPIRLALVRAAEGCLSSTAETGDVSYDDNRDQLKTVASLNAINEALSIVFPKMRPMNDTIAFVLRADSDEQFKERNFAAETERAIERGRVPMPSTKHDFDRLVEQRREKALQIREERQAIVSDVEEIIDTTPPHFDPQYVPDDLQDQFAEKLGKALIDLREQLQSQLGKALLPARIERLGAQLTVTEQLLTDVGFGEETRERVRKLRRERLEELLHPQTTIDNPPPPVRNISSWRRVSKDQLATELKRGNILTTSAPVEKSKPKPKRSRKAKAKAVVTDTRIANKEDDLSTIGTH